ncbi:glycosyltransferase [Bifidobacterium sp. CP2]|uniref:glycosyltransferase n=1 Tax=Bifidobacterium TaxID=1678 RepID=UPI001BDCEEDA|nr:MULTISPECIES: glycosyltransferase [Bifidobacterium]MBT1182276.1 glycosyltransferase [Bifidobacterium sp. CP2]MBW3081340.1 glycosyltransferase [Bifidobacterium saguinibicoloris]
MPKLSIIVPIYNVESFLDQCLESIRKQTFEDWECLLFSDGSKDGSIDIMKRFAAEDARFKVIDKQNEGYGTTCNRGLDMAQGDWVCVVEPDDFIDPNMYENLLSADRSEKGKVDVIKGSYWLYYDAREPYTEALEAPNLARFMPKRRIDFTLDEFTEPFYHHPSIWSAVYRRDFLNGDNKAGRKIRFKQIPGAGWTDNPFFAETMVLADRIVWMPGQYYYYRQTNPGASTFLKDFRLPFDRLRDMREFLDEQRISRPVLHAFYSREFDYVTSVIGEFGYDDKNPEVRKLIREVFESMDRNEVFLMDNLRPEFLDYYMDFMGESYEAKHHEVNAHPDLSIVLLTKDARSWIVETLESYAKFNRLSCEFILIDEGSQDSTMNIADNFAQKDRRFVVKLNASRAAGTGNGEHLKLAEQIRLAIENAHGEYTIFVPSNYVIGEKMLYASVAGAKKAQADVALPDDGNAHADYLLNRMRSLNLALPSSAVESPDSTRGPIYGPFQASDIPDAMFTLNRTFSWLRLYRTAFLKENHITASSSDVTNALYGFAGQTLLHADKIAFLDLKKDWKIRNVQRQQVGSAFWLALVKNIPYSSETDPIMPSVLEFGEVLHTQGLYDKFERGYLNAILTAFMQDIYGRYTPEHIEKYLSTYQEKVVNLLDVKDHGALYFYDADAFNDFQKIVFSPNLNLWLEERVLRDENILFELDKEINDIRNSTRFKTGETIVETVKKLSPSNLIAQAQAKARLGKRTH